MSNEKVKYNNPPVWIDFIGVILAISAAVFIIFVFDSQFTITYNPAMLKNAQGQFQQTSVNNNANSLSNAKIINSD